MYRVVLEDLLDKRTYVVEVEAYNNFDAKKVAFDKIFRNKVEVSQLLFVYRLTNSTMLRSYFDGYGIKIRSCRKV